MCLQRYPEYRKDLPYVIRLVEEIQLQTNENDLRAIERQQVVRRDNEDESFQEPRDIVNPRMQQLHQFHTKYMDQEYFEKVADWFKKNALKLMQDYLPNLVNKSLKLVPMEELDGQRRNYLIGRGNPNRDLANLRAGILRPGHIITAPRAEKLTKLKLLKILKTVKLFNSFLFICHGILLIQTTQLERSNSSHGGSRVVIERRSNFKTILEKLSRTNINSTSWQPELYCHVLALILLNYLNNLYWFHWRRTIKVKFKYGDYMFKMSENRLKWSSSSVKLLLSSKYVYQVIVLVISVALDISMDMNLKLYCLNQTLFHGYNWYRVSRYLKVFTQEGQVDEGLSEAKGLICDCKNSGWSAWPLHFCCCDIKLRDSIVYGFERLLLMNQILGVKVTIFTFLINFESNSNSFSGYRSQRNSLLLLLFLIKAFLVMHSYYDKYYLRYMDRTWHIESGNNLLRTRQRGFTYASQPNEAEQLEFGEFEEPEVAGSIS